MKKKIINIIVVLMLVMITSIVTAYATSYLYRSEEVSYDDTESELGAEEVQTALDKLYASVNSYNVLKVDLTKAVRPVGSIYQTTAYSTPAQVGEALGGTWERYGVDRVLRGTTTAAEITGGSGTATLTIDNLPEHTHTISHTHTFTGTIASSGAHTHTVTGGSATVNGTTNKTLTAASAGAHTHSAAIKTTSDEAAGYGLTKATQTFANRIYVTSAGSNTTTTYTYTSSAGDHQHTVTGTVTVPSVSIASSGAHQHTVPAMTTSAASEADSGAYGSATPTSFSTIDPYITVYMYKRIS